MNYLLTHFDTKNTWIFEVVGFWIKWSYKCKCFESTTYFFPFKLFVVEIWPAIVFCFGPLQVKVTRKGKKVTSLRTWVLVPSKPYINERRDVWRGEIAFITSHSTKLLLEFVFFLCRRYANVCVHRSR